MGDVMIYTGQVLIHTIYKKKYFFTNRELPHWKNVAIRRRLIYAKSTGISERFMFNFGQKSIEQKFSKKKTDMVD
jgi:hypothetical protein